MKNIAIYCVNYNSYEYLHNYLASIDRALKPVVADVSLTVHVIDNTTPPLSIEYSSDSFILKTLSTNENKGYFGAIRYAMDTYSPNEFDYCIISNVDILLSDDFFVKLNTQAIGTDIGWIAPQIYSDIEQRDRNPKILNRYSKRKLEILRIFFKFPILYNIYTHTAYKRKKLQHHKAGEIYAGHGSMIILTKNYFQKCGIIDYPVFLFCEEIYIAELCRKSNLKVIYNPDIKVTDAEHASTSAFRNSLYCRYNFEAVSYIIKNFYQ